MDADAPLTKQELEWIVATRDVAATQSLPCTNVELVQLAIVTKGDTAKTLSRLKKMAAWKKDLSLDDISFADAFRKANATVMTSGYGVLTPYGRARSGSRVLCHWHSVRPMHMLPPLLTSVWPPCVCYSITRCLCDTALCPSCAIADILSHTWRGVHEQKSLPAEIEYQSAFKAIIGVFEACTSSLADARRGICVIAECSGVVVTATCAPCRRSAPPPLHAD